MARFKNRCSAKSSINICLFFVGVTLMGAWQSNGRSVFRNMQLNEERKYKSADKSIIFLLVSVFVFGFYS